jgi:hypothetical protein
MNARDALAQRSAQQEVDDISEQLRENHDKLAQRSEPCKHVWSNPPGGRLICDECGMTVKEDDMPEDDQRSEPAGGEG